MTTNGLPGHKPAPRYLSVADVADQTGLGQKTVRRMIDAGTLPARRAGRRVLIRVTDLESWFLNLPAAGGMVSEPLSTTTTTTTTTTGTQW